MRLFSFFEPKPFNQGYLPEVDGHKVFFWEFGNPKGRPIISFHGGPGSSSKAKNAKLFDMKKHRLIMFDQRGCGSSLPKGGIEKNTTQDLLKDAGRLLDFLNIKGKVIVQGGSWGSTMALLFAEENPDRVSYLLLAMIFLADEDSKKWMLEDSGYFYPDVLDKIKKSYSGKKSLAQETLDDLLSGAKQRQLRAMSLYGAYEHNLGSLEPVTKVDEIDEKGFNYARIFMHYDAHDFFLKSNQIIKNIRKIEKIPTLIVHNRLDFDCPVKGAYKLKQASSNKSKLVIVPETGHSGKMLRKVNKEEIREFLKDV